MPNYRYIMIAKKIQTEIESGNLLPGMPVPSSREICRMYNVSHLTAIHALKMLSKKGFLSHLPGHNYSVSRKLDKMEDPLRFLTLLFRYISTSGREFFGNRIIGGITREASMASVSSLFVSSVIHCYALRGPDLGEQDFAKILREALMIPPQNIGFIADFFIPDHILSEIMQETGRPAVVIGRVSSLPDVHSVVLDCLPAYQLMLKTLKRLGYDFFICCEYRKSMRYEAEQQHEFFLQVAATEEGSMVQDFNCKSAAQRVEILERLLKRHKDRKCAILAPSDVDARWIIEHLKYLNIQIPEQVGVVGFYGTRLASEFLPKLSCLSCAPEMLGQVAAQLLISGDQHYRVHKIPMEFMFGETI